MADTGGRGETYEGHGRIYLGRIKGVAATGIQKALKEQGRVGGGDHVNQRVGARTGESVYWDGDR